MTVFYEKGGAQVFADFTDHDGAYSDPASVKLKWVDPNGVASERTYGSGGTPPIVKASTGRYTCDIPIGTKYGTWRFFWYAEDQVSLYGEFDVVSIDFI